MHVANMHAHSGLIGIESVIILYYHVNKGRSRASFVVM
jgi:hypothetical protein